MQSLQANFIIETRSNNMQVLQSTTYKVDEDATKDALLSVVADKYCRSILEVIMDVPKSAMELSLPNLFRNRTLSGCHHLETCSEDSETLCQMKS